MSSMTLLQNFQFTIRVNLPESGDLGEPATVWVNLPQSGDLVDLEKSRQQKLPIFTRIFMPCTYLFQEVICLCRFYVVLPRCLTFLLVVFNVPLIWESSLDSSPKSFHDFPSIQLTNPPTRNHQPVNEKKMPLQTQQPLSKSKFLS